MMNKRRSTLAAILSFVLAVVVMASFATAALATTEGTPVTDVADLEAVLNGTAEPTEGIDYDVDGNGIVEMDDLAVLKGETLPDLLPNGGNDWLAEFDPEMGTDDALFQTKIVRGDSTKAIGLSAAKTSSLYYSMEDPVDLTTHRKLTFDTLWTDGTGTIAVYLWGETSSDALKIAELTATEAGWSTVEIELKDVPADVLATVNQIDFELVEGNQVYIDNLQKADELAKIPVSFVTGSNGSAVAAATAYPGYAYGFNGDLPEPKRPFHTFLGWYLEPEYTTLVTSDTVVEATAAHTLYAKWEEVEGGAPLAEGGVNAILSVSDEPDVYIYKTEVGSKYEEKYLAMEIDPEARVASFDFKFLSATKDGAAVEPGMYVSDTQATGVGSADKVIVDKETGKPVTSLEIGKWYTIYLSTTRVALTDNTFKVIPLGPIDQQSVYEVALTAPVNHYDAPRADIALNSGSANHSATGLYKTSAGLWEYFYYANNRLYAMAYNVEWANANSYNNTAQFRRLVMTTKTDSSAMMFETVFQESFYKEAGSDTAVELYDLQATAICDHISSDPQRETLVVTVYDAQGNAVALADRAKDTPYTVVITRENGEPIPANTAVELYSLGYRAGSVGGDEANIAMQIKSVRAKKSYTAHDGSVTVNGSINVNSDGTVLYNLHSGITSERELNFTFAGTGYKQLRFQFNITEFAVGDSSTFAITWDDGDAKTYNNPLITILDENNKAVKAADVEPGKWYTVVIFGTEELINSTIDPDVTYQQWFAGNINRTGKLTFGTGSGAADIEMTIRELEAHTALFGYRMTGPEIGWGKEYVDGYGWAYAMDQNKTTDWASRTEIVVQGTHFSAFEYDFCVTEKTSGTGNLVYGWGTKFYDAQGTEVAASELAVGTWYKAVVDMSTWSSGTKYQYANVADNGGNNVFKAYMANLNWLPADTMHDTIAPAITATIQKQSAAEGTFTVERVTRDTGRGTYAVAGTSAAWNNRLIKVSIDASKELVQIDFRFLQSRNAEGKDVTPTLAVSTTYANSLTAAQYIVLDENDNPVTKLEIGKDYRLFITTGGYNTFYLAPNIDADIKLQLESVKTYNADELTVKFVSEDRANAPMSALLSRYGKLEYALASTTADTKTLSVRPVTVGAKQVRFSFLLKEVGTMAMSVNAGSITITDASGAAVAASALQADTWYTAVITNNGGTVGNTTLTVGSGAVSMLIKDMAAYTTTDAPVEGETGIFRGLDADEMLLAGYLAPRDGYLIGNTPKPSMIRDDIYAALAAAGINYLADNQVTYSGTNVESAREMLRLAAKYGIGQWMRANDVFVVGDVLSTETKTATYDWAEREYTHYNYWNVDAGYEKVKEKLAEMYQFESFGGLYLRDEPRSDLFTLIGTGLTYMRDYVAELQAAGDTDAVLNGFANLLPGVGNSAWTNDTEEIGGWQGYINAFIDRTDANYVMFDMYPLEGEEGLAESSFFDYLGQMGYTAGQAGLPWMGAVQVGGGEPSYDASKRVATEGDTHWNVNTMLAFGAKGLIYYMTVSPPYFADSVDDTTKDNHSLINVYGETTVYHDYVSEINANIKAIDHVLMNSTHKGVILAGTGANSYSDSSGSRTTLLNTTEELNSVKLSSISGSHALAGAFDYEGKTALYVVNNNMLQSDSITLNFTGNYYYEVIQDAQTDWANNAVGSNKMSVSLLPGRAALVIVHESAPDIKVKVSFDLNYETSALAPASVQLDAGTVYGELPVVERNMYTFEGWFLNPECTGEAVTAETALSSLKSHTLYAKWAEILDDNPITFSTNHHCKDIWTRTHTYEDSKHIYTFHIDNLTNGASMGWVSWMREINVDGVSEGDEVAIKFRYTEAKDASGNDIVPTITLAANVDNDTPFSMVITDMDGNVVYSGSGNSTGLEIGTWYILTAKVPTGGMSLRPCRSFDAANFQTTAKTLTIQFADRELVPADTNPVVIANPETYWTSLNRISGSKYAWVTTNAVSGGSEADNWQRKITLTNPLAEAAVLTMDFKFTLSTDADGNPVTPDLYAANGATALNYAIMEKATGKIVGQCEVGKEYTLFVSADASSSVGVIMVQSYHFGLRAKVEILDRGVLELPAAGDVTMRANSAYYGTVQPYLYDGQWGYAYVSYTGIQSSSVDLRKVLLNTATDYETITFEFKYDVSQRITADGQVSNTMNHLYSASAFYTLDGTKVTTGEMVNGQWYRAVATKAALNGAGSAMIPMNMDTAPSGGKLNIAMAFRNLVAVPADTNPITVSVNSSSYATLTHTYENGEHIYNYATVDGMITNSNGIAYVRGLDLKNLPANSTISYRFRFTEVLDTNGQPVTNPTAFINFMNSSANAKVVNAETGAVVVDTNGNTNTAPLEVGVWYTVTFKNTSSTTLNMWLCNNFGLTTSTVGTIKAQIGDRWYVPVDENPITVSVNSSSYATLTHTYENGEHIYNYATVDGMITNSNGIAYVRGLDLKNLPANSTISYRFRFTEVLDINGQPVTNPTAFVTYLGASANAKVVDAETGATVVESTGDTSTTALEVGKWYIITIKHTDKGEVNMWMCSNFGLTTSTVGTIKAQIGNREIIPTETATVSFDLNYAGAANGPEAITVEQGAAYGTLPTPERTGYTFEGWFKDAACTGTAVSASDAVTAAHTLYAKWTAVADPNPITVSATSLWTSEHSYIDGEHIYTYSLDAVYTKDGWISWYRKISFAGAAANDEVAIKFRYTVAKDTEGNGIAPTIAVGSGINSTALPMTILDMDGNVVYCGSGNSYGLEIGKWYILRAAVPSTGLELRPCRSFDVDSTSSFTTTAKTLTLEISSREVLAAAPADTNPIVVTSNSAASATVTPVYVNGEYSYVYTPLLADYYNRRAILNVPADAAEVSVDFRFMQALQADGSPLAINMTAHKGGYADALTATFKDANGNTVAGNALQAGKWYTMTVIPNGNTQIGIWTDYYNTGVPQLSIEFRNRRYVPVDTNPITLSVNSAAAALSHTYEGGEHIYNYSTYSASNLDPYVRSVSLTGFEGATHVAIEFRYTAAYKADGTTPIDLAIAAANGTARVARTIVDANGNLVSSADGVYEKTLVVGEWYTMIIPTNGKTTLSLWTCVTYMSDAPKITMEFRTRDTYVQQMSFSSNGGFTAQYLSYVNTDSYKGFQYNMDGTTKTTASQDSRRLTATMAKDGLRVVSFDFMITNLSGSANGDVWDAASIMKFYDAETKASVARSELTAGKWYTAVYAKDGNLGTAAIVLAYLGGGQAGGLDMYLRNVSVSDAYVTTAGIGSVRADSGDGAAVFNYTYDSSVNGVSAEARRLLVKHGATATQLQFKFKFTETTVGGVAQIPGFTLTNYGQTVYMTTVITDASGNQVTPANVQQDQWYTATVTYSGGNIPNLSIFVGMSSASEENVMKINLQVKEFVFS